MAQARIPLPTRKDAPGVLALAAAVGTAITTKGKDSLLVGALAAELQAAAAKVPAALAAHKEAKDLELRLEKLYEQRNNVVAEALPLVQRASKALQGNLGKARLRDMGDYGFTVNDSPPPPSRRRSRSRGRISGTEKARGGCRGPFCFHLPGRTHSTTRRRVAVLAPARSRLPSGSK